MKIEKVELFYVKIPLIPVYEGGIAPYRGHNLPVGTGLTSATSCIYKVTVDSGLIGWGETNPIINLKFHRRLFDEKIRDRLCGVDVFDRNEILQQLSQTFVPPIFSKSLLAGIDIACWDIIGKAVQQPVYNLLGGKVRDRAGIAYCIGIYEDVIARDKIQSIRDQGFKTIKTKGGGDVNDDIRRAWLCREWAGDEIELRIDMNQGYDITQAVRFLGSVESLNLEYVEQPILVNHFDQMATLIQKSLTPIAINEDCYIPHNLLQYILSNAIDLAVIDLDPLGGISALVKMANICQELGIPLAHHCGFDMGIKTAAILQVYAAKAALSHPTDSTYMGHADDILVEKIPIIDGSFVISDKPGLGIEVDPEKISRYAVTM